MKKATPTPDSSRQSLPTRWLELLLVLFAIIAAWIGSFCLVTASRVFASMYHTTGLDAGLPIPTLATFRASQNHLPWVFAVLATVLLAYLFARTSRYLTAACAAISTVGMIAVSVAALSLAIPNYELCDGVAIWPDWPDWSAKASGTANVLTHSPPHLAARKAQAVATLCH
jgi:hypothetical protein